MKSEYGIAKQNVKNWGKSSEDRFIRMYYYNCEKHKLICQRFLDWLGQFDFSVIIHNEKVDKIIDLKNAIKHYEENGI